MNELSYVKIVKLKSTKAHEHQSELKNFIESNTHSIPFHHLSILVSRSIARGERNIIDSYPQALIKFLLSDGLCNRIYFTF